MPASTTFQLIEHRLPGGDLAEQLRAWQQAGVAANAMARLLTNQTAVPVTGETVRRWLRKLGVAA